MGEHSLVEQPTKAPVRKVTWGGAVAGLFVVLATILHAVGIDVGGIDTGPAALGSAIASVMGFVTAYMTKSTT